VGKKRYKEGDYGDAFKYFTHATELGDVDAQYNLSVLYYKGEGVEKNAEKEVYHLEEAAIGGHHLARHNLAIVEKENGRTDRAIKHFIIAAKLGYANALEAVRKRFHVGLVSKHDYEATLRGHQATMNAMKSEQREEAYEFAHAF